MAEFGKAAEELRCNVIRCSDLQDGLQQYKTEEPDITFLSDNIDFKSTRKPRDRYELVKMIREWESANGKKHKLIYLTGTGVNVLFGGADEYVNTSSFIAGEAKGAIKRVIGEYLISKK